MKKSGCGVYLNVGQCSDDEFFTALMSSNMEERMDIYGIGGILMVKNELGEVDLYIDSPASTHKVKITAGSTLSA